MRESNVAYVLIRVLTTDGPFLLLRRHEKWGDWSLVGGHVEERELDNWGLAATREASEELEPLAVDRDFIVTPIHKEPITWGPEPSRSARDQRTIYHIQYYALTFLRDPVALLKQIPFAEFLLVPERDLVSSRHTLGSPVHRARRYIQGGLEAVPLAWPEVLASDAIPDELRHLTPEQEPPR